MQYMNLVETDLPEAVWGSVMEITDECASGLFLDPMDEVHPLYRYRKAVIKQEYNAYLGYTISKLIKGVGRFSTGLILAVEPDRNRVVGFILYSRDFNRDDVVGIVGVAVRKEYRNQGIMTAMIEQMRQSANDIGLSCSLNMVRVYHRLGFQILGDKGPQVRMGWGGVGGDMAVFGPGSFDRVDSVQDEYKEMRSALGANYNHVCDDYAKLVEAESLKVQQFVTNWRAGIRTFP